MPVRYNDRNDKAVLVQVRSLDVRRLIKRMGTLGSENFKEIQAAFLAFYGDETIIDESEVLSPDSIHPANGAGIGG